MGHVKKIELIEFSAGRLNEDDAGRVKSHLAGCELCRAALGEIQSVREDMTAWQVADSSLSSGDIIAYVERENARGRIHFFTGSRFREVVKIAAAVVIAAVIGHYAARSTMPAESDRVAGVQAPAYLAVLGLDVAEGLSSSVLYDADAAGGELP